VTEAGDGSRGEKFHAAGPTEGGFLIVGSAEIVNSEGLSA
jgi:hypothetical protein